MTNKEAIAILTHNWKYHELIDNVYQYDALYLAINALKARPQIISCFNCKYDDKSAADEPCKYCEKHCQWQAKDEEVDND